MSTRKSPATTSISSPAALSGSGTRGDELPGGVDDGGGDGGLSGRDATRNPLVGKTEVNPALGSDAIFLSVREGADNNCVYRNEIVHSVGECTQILQDVAADPTLPRTKSVRCAVCGHPEAVFFQATARGEEGMALFFVCCNPSCGHRWRD